MSDERQPWDVVLDDLEQGHLNGETCVKTLVDICRKMHAEHSKLHVGEYVVSRCGDDLAFQGPGLNAVLGMRLLSRILNGYASSEEAEIKRLKGMLQEIKTLAETAKDRRDLLHMLAVLEAIFTKEKL